MEILDKVIKENRRNRKDKFLPTMDLIREGKRRE